MEVPNLILYRNILHVLETHEVAVELLTPENALPLFNMCEEHFYEGIENGTVPSCIVDGVTLIPVIVVDPDNCEICGCVVCVCDDEDDDDGDSFEPSYHPIL